MVTNTVVEIMIIIIERNREIVKKIKEFIDGLTLFFIFPDLDIPVISSPATELL
jgi:hypothetical protein